jgi:hypothetical protein
MIDKKIKKSELSIAKEISARYISNPTIDAKGDGSEVIKIKSIYVINKECAVYVNSELETVKAYADSKNMDVTIVMENGKVVPDAVEEVEETEITEEAPKEKPKKKKS